MRVIAGPEKKTRVMSDKERLITAYHEMGHAIVGHFLEHSDPVHKISIISRGQALGYTISMPQEDKFLTTKAELTDNLAMTLGGRAAEEIVFGEITTGASNDLEKVTATAKQMVMRFGMSEKLGPRVFGHDHGHALPRPRVLGRARLLRRDRARDRRRDPPHRRGRPSARQGPPHRVPRRRWARSPRSSSSARRSRRRSSRRLLAGKTEEEVFGSEAPPPPGPPIPGDPAPERAGREAPRPLPRPGLAGGGLEARGPTSPRSPSSPSTRRAARWVRPRVADPAGGQSRRMPGDVELLLRVGVGAALGAALGMEREHRGHVAGWSDADPGAA